MYKVGKELKPCPFCGGKAEFVRNNINCCYIQCNNCFIIGRSVAIAHDAVEAWNTRANEKT